MSNRHKTYMARHPNTRKPDYYVNKELVEKIKKSNNKSFEERLKENPNLASKITKFEEKGIVQDQTVQCNSLNDLNGKGTSTSCGRDRFN